MEEEKEKFILPVGFYNARVVESGLSKTQAGDPQIALMLEIVDGEMQGERVPWYGNFTENTWERTIQSLRHCGWKGDDLRDLSGVRDNVVPIETEHNEYKNKVSARVRWINQVGGLPVKQRMTDDEAAKFAAKMKAKIGSLGASGLASAPPASKKSTPAPTRSAPSDGPPLHDDSDSPFSR